MRTIRIAVALTAVAALALLAAPGGAAAHAGPHKAAAKPKLKIEILDPRQDDVLADGVRIRTTVRGRDGAKGPVKRRLVKLRLASQAVGEGPFVRIAARQTLQIAKAGTRSGVFPLTEEGKRRLAGCGSQTLRAKIRNKVATA